MNVSQRKQRILTMVAIVAGAFASALTWKAFHSPVAAMSDEEARNIGYSSAEDRKRTEAIFQKSIADKRLSDSDFATARDILKNGSMASKTFMITAFTNSVGFDQHKKALDILHSVGMTQMTAMAWRIAFEHWGYDTSDKQIFPLLTSDSNPTIAQMAKEIQHDQGASKQ